MSKLFLLRHLKSQWNEENRFTGWVDVPLAKNQGNRAKICSEEIFKNRIDAIYSSSLFRNMDTVAEILEKNNQKYPIFIHFNKGKMKSWGKFMDLNNNDVPVYVTEKLNERFYGKLQGLDKKETIEKYGEEKVRFWRRSYNVRPPGGESLRDVFKRTIPFYKKHVEKDLMNSKNILVVSSHNSLRAIVKYIEKIPDKDIINLEIAFGGLIEYNFDGKLNLKEKKINEMAL